MVSNIHPYLIDLVRLSDGGRLTIRPVLLQDADAFQSFVRNLSVASRRNRFFRALHELPQSLLEQLTDVDHQAHLAFVAETFEGGSRRIVGEARYVVGTTGHDAEVALAVADEWQGRGIGRLLLGRLITRASAQGITLLHGQVLGSNDAMHRLARRAGFGLRLDPSTAGLLRMEQRLKEIAVDQSYSHAA